MTSPRAQVLVLRDEGTEVFVTRGDVEIVDIDLTDYEKRIGKPAELLRLRAIAQTLAPSAGQRIALNRINKEIAAARELEMALRDGAIQAREKARENARRLLREAGELPAKA